MNTQKKILANYENLRGAFLDAADAERQKFISDLFSGRYLEHLPDRRNARVLEIGCNKGYMLKALKDHGFTNITGIDLCPEDIELAQKISGVSSLYCEDLFTFLKDKKFDVILSKDVMEHVAKDRQEEFVKTIYDSLNTDGVAVIQVPNMDWVFSNHERYMDFTHEIGYTRESLADMFRLSFDSDHVKVLPCSYIFTPTFKTKIAYGIIRPLMLRLLRFGFKILGEGASDVWFEHREIMVIARKG